MKREKKFELRDLGVTPVKVVSSLGYQVTLVKDGVLLATIMLNYDGVVVVRYWSRETKAEIEQFAPEKA